MDSEMLDSYVLIKPLHSFKVWWKVNESLLGHPEDG